MQLTSVAMSILPELLWLIFSCALLRPCGNYNKATLVWCRSFAAFTYHELLRPRCYSNKVTPARIITTSSMAYSVVDASEHLLSIIRNRKTRTSLRCLCSRNSPVSLPTIGLQTFRMQLHQQIGTSLFSFVDLSPTSSAVAIKSVRAAAAFDSGTSTSDSAMVYPSVE